MLTTIELCNFKNVSGKRTINVCDPTDGFAFEVVIGRNGSGKSCMLEAVEWVLYDTNRKELRAQNLEQLINVNADSKFVKVVLTLFVQTTK